MLPELDLGSTPLALGSAALAGFAVGIVPVGVAEVFAIAIGAVVPRSLAVAMLLCFTLAHVASKWVWYWVGTAAGRISHPLPRRMIDRTRVFLDARPGYGPATLAAGAVASLPPFHLTAIAAGILRMPLRQFLLICFAGRLLRFGLLASVPALARLWFD